MNRVDAQRLKDDLGTIAEDVEQLLEDVSEGADERAEEVRSRLRAVRDRVIEAERAANQRVREGAVRTDRYLRENAWGVVAATAAVAFLAGLLSRGLRR